MKYHSGLSFSCWKDSKELRPAGYRQTVLHLLIIMWFTYLHSDEIVDNLGESWLARGRGVNRNRLPGRMVPERTVRITTHRASAPRFTFKPQSRVVEIGQTARLICGVRGK